MSVLIFGLTGMLGHKIYQRLSGTRTVFGTVRLTSPTEIPHLFEPDDVIYGVDATDRGSVRRAIEQAEPEFVINAVGLIKQLMVPGDFATPLVVNSVFPNVLESLSQEYGFRLITISTDCVFAGSKGNYREEDEADARDLYGLSKFLGETSAPNCLTIRTSMIGRELMSSNSIVEWFLANRGGRVMGFTHAMYSGLTTIELANVISRLLDGPLTGLYHVAGPPISKFDLLSLVNKHFDANCIIDPDSAVSLDRTLNADAFNACMGYEPPSWDAMINAMAADPTPYDDMRG